MSNTQPTIDQAVQFRNRLMSVLSHGTKGLFANIFWLIEMIENDLADAEMLRQMLPELKSVAQKNLDDYTNTLNWIKIQREDFKPTSVKINVYGLFKQLYDFFEQQLSAQCVQLIFDGDRSADFCSDIILVQLILKKIIENILNSSLSEKMIIFKISKPADHKEISIKVTGNGMKVNKILMPETADDETIPLNQMHDEMNIDIQFAKDIASILNGAINVANNELAITLTLPLN